MNTNSATDTAETIADSASIFLGTLARAAITGDAKRT